MTKYLSPLSKPVFAYSVEAFQSTQLFQTLCIVYRDLQQLAALKLTSEALPCSGIQYIWVQGGRRRQDSVYNALKSLQISADYVFIHDCARPLIQSKTLVAMWEQLQLLRGLALAHPVVDSIKQIAQESNLETPI